MQGEQAMNRADDRDEIAEGFANLKTEAERNEFEAWLDSDYPEPSPIDNCLGCGNPVYTVEGFCGVCEPNKL